MGWSPLTTHWQENRDDRDSRLGTKIDSIGDHHAAGTSREGPLSLFAPGGKTVTPNYFIYRTEVWGIVDEDFRAFTTAAGPEDRRSITFEIANVTGAPHWAFDDDTLETVIAMHVDLCRRYGITPRHGIPGFWEHRNIKPWTGRSYDTVCAGPSWPMQMVIKETARRLNGDDMGYTDWPERDKDNQVLDIMNKAQLVNRNGHRVSLRTLLNAVEATAATTAAGVKNTEDKVNLLRAELAKLAGVDVDEAALARELAPSLVRVLSGDLATKGDLAALQVEVLKAVSTVDDEVLKTLGLRRA